MLTFGLYDNVLTPDPTDYMAVIQDSRKVTIADLIADMTGEGSILKETECAAVTHALFRALGRRLQQGQGFTSEYLVIDHSISGVFTSLEDNFDPKRHQVNTNVRLGSQLREMSREIKVEKIKGSVPVPVIESCYDHWTQKTNDEVTARGSVDLRGENLKIGDQEDPAQGVFFIGSDGTEVKVSRLALNTPKKLVCVVPEELWQDDYTLEVRTVMKGTRKLRSGRLNQTLMVG